MLSEPDIPFDLPVLYEDEAIIVVAPEDHVGVTFHVGVAFLRDRDDRGAAGLDLFDARDHLGVQHVAAACRWHDEHDRLAFVFGDEIAQTLDSLKDMPRKIQWVLDTQPSKVSAAARRLPPRPR